MTRSDRGDETDGTIQSRVTVLGAGRMGTSVASLFLDAGGQVNLVCSPRQDADAVRADLTRQLGSRELGSLVVYGTVDAGSAGARFIIECLPEDLDLKQTQLQVAAQVADSTCVLATNTSSLGVDAIAQALDRPEFLVGLHYLFPAGAFPFVEVIRGRRSSDASIATAVRYVVGCGQRPILLAKDVPGTVVNRLQFALVREAVRLVDDGIAAAADVDYIVERGLAPRWAFAGPLSTAELGGADLFATIADRLFPDLSRDTDARDGVARRHLDPERLRQLAHDRAAFLVALQAVRDAADSHGSGM